LGMFKTMGMLQFGYHNGLFEDIINRYNEKHQHDNKEFSTNDEAIRHGLRAVVDNAYDNLADLFYNRKMNRDESYYGVVENMQELNQLIIDSSDVYKIELKALHERLTTLKAEELALMIVPILQRLGVECALAQEIGKHKDIMLHVVQHLRCEKGTFCRTDHIGGSLLVAMLAINNNIKKADMFLYADVLFVMPYKEEDGYDSESFKNTNKGIIEGLITKVEHGDKLDCFSFYVDRENNEQFYRVDVEQVEEACIKIDAKLDDPTQRKAVAHMVRHMIYVLEQGGESAQANVLLSTVDKIDDDVGEVDIGIGYSNSKSYPLDQDTELEQTRALRYKTTGSCDVRHLILRIAYKVDSFDPSHDKFSKPIEWLALNNKRLGNMLQGPRNDEIIVYYRARLGENIPQPNKSSFSSVDT